MDYLKLYENVLDCHTKHTDFVNVIENKMEEINKKLNIGDDLELSKCIQKQRDAIDRVKFGETMLLKCLNELEQELEGLYGNK